MDFIRYGQQKVSSMLYPPAIKYHGLVNQGSTCYLNSVLQVLFMTKDFREAVERHISDNPDSEHIDLQLESLFGDLKSYPAYTYKITKKLGINKVYEQQDAAEYFEKILAKTSDDASKIFHGQLTHKTTCSSCGTEIDAAGPFWNLTLALEDSYSQNFSVVNGIEKYFRESSLNGENQMYCEKCDDKSDATTKCVINHHPEVLMLLLKRFEFDYYSMRYVKINCTVDVPCTLQIPENQPYELYAVVEHSGDLSSGHYIATIKSEDDGRCYSFNDSCVTELHSQPFQLDTFQNSTSAYLLFYRKEKVSAAGTQVFRERSTPGGSPLSTCETQDQSEKRKRKREEEDEGTAEKGRDPAVTAFINRDEGTGFKETDRVKSIQSGLSPDISNVESKEEGNDLHVESKEEGNDLHVESKEEGNDLHVESKEEGNDLHVESKEEGNNLNVESKEEGKDLHVESKEEGNDLHVESKEEGNDLHVESKEEGNDLHVESKEEGNDLHVESKEEGNDLHVESKEEGNDLHVESKEEGNDLHIESKEEGNDLHVESKEEGNDLNVGKSSERSEESVDDQHKDSVGVGDVSHYYYPGVSDRLLKKLDESRDAQRRERDVKTGKTGRDEQSEQSGTSLRINLSMDTEHHGHEGLGNVKHDNLEGQQQMQQAYGPSVEQQGDGLRTEKDVEVDKKGKPDPSPLIEDRRVDGRKQNMSEDLQGFEARKRREDRRDVEGAKELKRGDDKQRTKPYLWEGGEDQDRRGLDGVRQDRQQQKTSVPQDPKDVDEERPAKEQERKPFPNRGGSSRKQLIVKTFEEETKETPFGTQRSIETKITRIKTREKQERLSESFSDMKLSEPQKQGTKRHKGNVTTSAIHSNAEKKARVSDTQEQGAENQPFIEKIGDEEIKSRGHHAQQEKNRKGKKKKTTSCCIPCKHANQTSE
ncbi:titin homolog isoform X4 [Trematomus bernacchii]|uniref:titin homolog isoform X4 n=1 Tax=Trematomus bernacchii TaxID=40690 RepID=UPI00146F0AAD|nr:titin homolog isoform X4 [Trematomus bernacchii]